MVSRAKYQIFRLAGAVTRADIPSRKIRLDISLSEASFNRGIHGYWRYFGVDAALRRL